jgi:hypothetical protein
MSNVTRLPVQHPQYPRCPKCQAKLPTFNRAMITVGPDELEGCELLSLTYRVRCACRSEWNLTKNAS